ncbi:MAG: RNA methyltransferase [Hyphomicrobiaceae bacterium]
MRDRPPRRSDRRPGSGERSRLSGRGEERRHRAEPPERSGEKTSRIAGLPAVAALFVHAPERVERLYFTEEMKAEAGDYCVVLARSHRQYRLVGAGELERIAGTPMHGGIVALARPQRVEPFDAEAAIGWAEAGEDLLVLDGVGNPHNLGAILRTAAFFGMRRVLLSDHRGQAGPSDAATRVARGGMEAVRLYRADRLPIALKRLGRTHHVVGTALEGAITLDELIGRRAGAGAVRPVTLVLGNEEEGLARATLAACETVVTIPGEGEVQSLNVAASAAILIHALCGRSTRVG